jgi:hypothetical protein
MVAMFMFSAVISASSTSCILSFFLNSKIHSFNKRCGKHFLRFGLLKWYVLTWRSGTWRLYNLTYGDKPSKRTCYPHLRGLLFLWYLFCSQFHTLKLEPHFRKMNYSSTFNWKHCMEKTAPSIYLSSLDMHVAEVYAFSTQTDYKFYIRTPVATEERLRAHVARCGVFW